MSIFKNCSIPKHQGNIGEARAIYEYTKLGYIVAKPLIECCPYDLIIDDYTGTLKRVSVKTSKQLRKSYKGYNITGYTIQLLTSGGNTKQGSIRKPASHHLYDLLFVLTENDKCWSIPSHELGEKGVIMLDSSKQQFSKYQL